VIAKPEHETALFSAISIGEISQAQSAVRVLTTEDWIAAEP
jgi:hypothetical protein